MNNKENKSESYKDKMLKLLEEYKDNIINQYRYTGKPCINLRDNKVGIIIKENENGSIQVLESIKPKVINTHDNWNTLQLLNEEDF